MTEPECKPFPSWYKQENPEMTTIYIKWIIQYDNHENSDRGFWEEWSVTNGDISYRCSKEEHAEWLMTVLNTISQP